MNTTYIKEFPVSLSANKVKLKIYNKFHLNKQIAKVRIQKDALIRDYLQQLFSKVTFERSYQMAEKQGKKIWMMWQQGFENAPDIVKRCLSSLYQQKSEKMQVIEINDANLSQYVKFPDYIMEKYEAGLITRTHFSDLVRIKLLAMYGGLWLDATDFLSRPIPSDIFNYRFFSVKGAIHPENLLPFLKGQWTAFAMGGNDLDVFKLIDKLLMFYWAKHNALIDYWLIDYVIDYAYHHYQFVKGAIDQCPINNTQIHTVEFLIKDNMDEQTFHDVLYDSDTYIHKLSYKPTVIDPQSPGYQTLMKVIN